MRSGLVVAVAEDRQDRKDRKDRVDHVASLAVRAASLAAQVPTMTMMTVVTTVVDQVGREIRSFANKVPTQRETTRHSNQGEMRLPTLQGDSTEALVRVHLQQLLHNREEFSNL